MDVTFDELGEGVMLGTMPAYLERFGAANAKYIQKNHLDYDPNVGANAALTAANVISHVTETDYDMIHNDARRSVKRIYACEFQDALEGRSHTTKSFMCLLHKAVYQGSVNSGAEEGYDVHIPKRILFGDNSCDFDVRSRHSTFKTGQLPVINEAHVAQEDADELALRFYLAILVSFVDYVYMVLPGTRANELLQRCRIDNPPTLQFTDVAKLVALPLRGAAHHAAKHLFEAR